MKRRVVHLVFGAGALLCASVSAFYGWQMKRAADQKQAIERIQSADHLERLPALPTASTVATLARANALSRLGDPDAAARAYNRIIQLDPDGPAGNAARFNLGNLYLRQSLRSTPPADSGPEPDLELAKQRYRDLLKRKPDAWDARYNLEQALRLAPELEQATPGEKDIKERRRVRLPGMSSVQLP